MANMKRDLGSLIDTLEHLTCALKLSMPDSIHVMALRESLPDLVKEMKDAYVDEMGENPWATHPGGAVSQGLPY